MVKTKDCQDSRDMKRVPSEKCYRLANLLWWKRHRAREGWHDSGFHA